MCRLSNHTEPDRNDLYGLLLSVQESNREFVGAARIAQATWICPSTLCVLSSPEAPLHINVKGSKASGVIAMELDPAAIRPRSIC